MIVRTLDRRILLRTPDASAFRTLRYLECDPDLGDVDVDDDVIITIEPYADRYVIHEPGGLPNERLGTQDVVEFLHGRMLDWSLAALPDKPIVHAASLRKNGRRIVLFGGQGVGKTTLTLRLICAGYEFEGDENIFVMNGAVVARPRALRVKQSSLDLLPDLATVIAASPYFTDYRGQRIYNVDPRRLGKPWRIRQGPIDWVVVLRPNHGGYSSLRPISSISLVQDVLAESSLPTVERGAALGSLIRTVTHAKAFDMSVGTPESAAVSLDRALMAHT